MSNRVLILETEERSFEPWLHADYGIEAQLDKLSAPLGRVAIERLTTPEELLTVAAEIKNGGPLPARALVVQNIHGSSFIHNPYEAFLKRVTIAQPADYDKETDPVWVQRDDEFRPITPYTRLISSRLLQRVVPDVRYEATEEEARDYRPVGDIFRRAYASAGHDTLRPMYGGFLARLNRHLASTGQDFMSIVDARGENIADKTNITIEGADIDVKLPLNLRPIVDLSASHGLHDAIKRIGLVAQLLLGTYPQATQAHQQLDLPRYTTTPGQ